MNTTEEPITAYLYVGHTTEQSNFGDDKRVDYYKPIELTPTGETAPFDNRYTPVTDEPLFLTPAGATYQRQNDVGNTIDIYYAPFTGNGPTLRSRNFLHGHARDLDGVSLTQNTPSGANLDMLIAERRWNERVGKVIPAAEITL